jgi:hypothetical protein
LSNYKIYNNIKDVNNIEEIKSRKSKNIWCSFYQYNSIIKFLDGYLMLTINRLDYEDWKTLIKMGKSITDPTVNDWIKMWKIRDRMYSNKITTNWHRDNSNNTSDVYQINIQDFFDKCKKLKKIDDNIKDVKDLYYY